jgi:hypothetical protein
MCSFASRPGSGLMQFAEPDCRTSFAEAIAAIRSNSNLDA